MNCLSINLIKKHLYDFVVKSLVIGLFTSGSLIATALNYVSLSAKNISTSKNVRGLSVGLLLLVTGTGNVHGTTYTAKKPGIGMIAY